ncbi:energy transducer TonB [Pedosphaera parvula]|uniref:TonB family protein n=1 Tax=Pedosphaera parvula (strain Ellin514) TaxID=320771 RepID=B9XSV9_PEDPL|nr:energy transducer TonB [Pedosphaera parvula]EEF57068.1 TonB family protein [Pedosphaera parvula Ellin514]
MKMDFKRSLVVAIALHALLALAVAAYSIHLARSNDEGKFRDVEVSLVTGFPGESSETPATAAKVAAVPKPVEAPKEIKPVSVPPPKPSLEPPVVPRPVLPAPIAKPEMSEPVVELTSQIVTPPEPVVQAANTAHIASAPPEASVETAPVTAPSGSTAAEGSAASQATTPTANKGVMTQAFPRGRRSPAPDYPVTAKRRRHEGLVVLRVQVDAKGRPTQVEVKESSGFAELDEAAVETVRRRWEFEPARLNDVPVESEVDQPVQFTLER